MDSTEQNNSTNKVQIGTMVDPTLYAIIDKFRVDEDRSMSNMVERLLKSHPRIQPIIEAETATATA